MITEFIKYALTCISFGVLAVWIFQIIIAIALWIKYKNKGE